MSIDIEKINRNITSIPPTIAHEIERELSKLFDKCGIFYRVFARCKSATSTAEKLTKKEDEYREKGKKMQDLLGVRVALYFKDDIDLCLCMIRSKYKIIEIVKDEENSEIFSPVRLNVVCQMPESIHNQFLPELWGLPIDKTFEIQIRTVFSEGWHEIEHDLRYKHKVDWARHTDLSRNLNGIFATLETCDWAIINVLDQLAYQKYKAGDWNAMLRNHLRIRTDNSNLSSTISALFDNNQQLAKDYLKLDRRQFLLQLSNPNVRSFPKSLNNMVFLANELIIQNPSIADITPPLIKEHIAQIKTLISN